MLIPRPQKEAYLAGSLLLPEAGGLAVTPEFGDSAALYAKLLGTSLAADAPLAIGFDPTLQREAYRLTVGETGGRIAAADAAGALHGVVSALWCMDGGRMLPCCRIEDVPRFYWRGLMLDVCRHYFPLRTLLTMVDLLCMHKMNRLHLHLSDDQGFRVESGAFPLLNAVGSFRTGSVIRRGAGEQQDQRPHGGYYTQEEIRMLVAYAAARGVDVIPEIDIPGHALAMIAAYPELSCTGEPVEVATGYGISDFSATILCAGRDETLAFLRTLLCEVAALFPSPYFHIGGDEAIKRTWKTCPHCQARKTALGLKDERELQGWLMNQCADTLRSLGKRALVWNDGLAEALDGDVFFEHWTPAQRRSVSALNSGRKAVVSSFTHLYFDYPYAMTPLKKTYCFDPLLRGLRRNAEENVLGAECCIWTEWIEDEGKLFYNLLPRLAAVAERCWSAHGRDYGDFTARLPAAYRLYARMGLPFAQGRERAERPLQRACTVFRFFHRDAYAEVET